MKRILFFVFLALSTLLSFAQDGKVTLTTAASYDLLNKQVEEYSKSGLPRSAVGTLEVLLQKAQDERNFTEYVNGFKQWAGYRMDIAPDSILPDLQRLENLFGSPMLTQTADAKPRQAILHALVMSVYDKVRSSRLARGDDEMLELCKTKVREHTLAALDDKEALAGVDAKPYERLYKPCDDSRLYNNDVLSLLLDFFKENAFFNVYFPHANEEFLKQLQLTMPVYQQRQMKEAALLVQMEIWAIQSGLLSKSERIGGKERLELLKRMYEENGDAEVAADACMEYYNLTSFKTNQERLQFLRMAQERFPDSPYKKVFNSYEKRLFDKYVSVRVDGNVVAGQAFNICVNHKNVRKVEVRVDKGKKNTVFQKDVISENYVQSDDYVEEMIYDTLSLSLQPGTYTVTARCEDKQDVTKVTRVSSLKLITYQLPGEKRTVCVVDAITGMPVPGCKVLLGEDHYVDGSRKEFVSDTTYTTDKNGVALVSPYKRWEWAYAEKNKDDISNHVSLVTRHDRDEENESETFYKIFTDRSIYRPGQTIYVTAYAYTQLGDEVRVLKEQDGQFTLRDPNWEVVGNKEVKTDEFGMANAELVIPKGRLNGHYTIEFEDEEVSVRVEEYKRPTFDVEFEEQTGMVAFGDTVKVSGVAKTYFGVPVQGAKVTLNVERTESGFWTWWRRPGSWDKLNTLEVETDDEGKFSVDVFLDGDRAVDETLEQWCRGFSGVMLYRVSAIVTDQAGESHEQSTTLPVSARGFDLQIEAEDNIDRDKPSQIVVKALNVNRKEVSVTGTWKLFRYTRGNEGKGNYDDMVVDGTFEAGKPISIPGLQGMSLGSYKLEVRTTDEKDNKYYDSHAFTLYSTNGGDITLAADWFYCENKEITEEKGIDFYYALHADRPFVYAYIISKTKVERRRIERMDNKLQHLHIDFKPDYKDGLTFFLMYVRNDREWKISQSFTYVRPEKQLDIQWATFRDKLQPGQEETWAVTVKDKQGRPVKAQMLTTMYDASLDAIEPHGWGFRIGFFRDFPRMWAYSSTSGTGSCTMNLKFPSTTVNGFERCYNKLIPFSQRERNYYMTDGVMAAPVMMKSRAQFEGKAMAVVEEAAEMDDSNALHEVVVSAAEKKVDEPDENAAEPPTNMRSNFNETAFFYPNLMTDKDGLVTLSFKLPESLTKWQFMAFAHTKDVDYGFLKATAVAAKDFMVQPNMPRFVRTGDNITITARIINQVETPVAGKATIRLIDPETEKVVFTQTHDFSVEPNRTTAATFDYKVEDGYDMLICEIYAADGKNSDGERNWLPVLTDKKIITETVPFYLRGAGTKTVDISSLFNHNSPTAVNRKMTFDYTDNPAWNVVLALHGTATPTDDCAICWAASLYVNTVAKHLADRMPKLQNLIQQWENEEGKETTMTSELEKNQELKDILLQEAPWMLDAKDETDQRHKIAELFNENLINDRISRAKDKLKDLQLAQGAWTWFKGMQPSYYTTFAVCDKLSMMQNYFRSKGEYIDQDVEKMLQDGLKYLDKEELEDYERELKFMKKKNLKPKEKPLPGNSTLHYIYMVGIAQHKTSTKVTNMINDYLDRVQGRVTDFTMYGRANCAIALQAHGRDQQANAFVRSLREYTVSTPLMGRYYDTERALYSWFDYRIPTHVAAMRAMMATEDEFNDAQQYLDDMQVWLLRQKQGQKWDNVINTIQAVDILLSIAPDTTFHEAQLPQVTMAGKKLEITDLTAGMGFVKATVDNDIATDVMAEDKPQVIIEKRSPGLSWGTIYGQSLEALDRMEQNGEALTVERILYVYDVAATGDGWKRVDSNYVFKVGDKMRMRHVISATQDLDFVQVRSQHAACLEPLKTKSGYQSLGGRGGYLALHDASADFFFDRFQKGTVTIDLDMYVTSAGSYSNGIATVQCAYAPAFSGHSAGSRINVK